MATYLSQKELVKQIEVNLSALEAGTLGLSEMEEHVNLVRELYERTIVLRYKAFEHHSNVEIAVPTIEEVAPIVAAQEPVVESIVAPIIEDKIAEVEEEVSEIEEETDIEFDFFSTTEPVSEPENPVFEPEKIEHIPFFPEEKEEFTTVLEEQETEPIVDIPATTNFSTQTNFSERVFEIEREIRNQIGFNTLSTLIGSFGLNERLLYINELFDGSSESFSDAIKHLDNKLSLGDAVPFIEDIAQKFNWDIESEIVEEFIQKLCRRYA